MRANKSRWTVFLLIFLLVSGPPCCAASAQGGKEFPLFYNGNTGLILGTIGIGAVIAAIFLHNSADTQTTTISTAQLPIVLSSSNHNLLSWGGEVANGEIVVQNGNTYGVAGFTIATDDSANPITIDPNSSCYGIVAAGEQCKFKISYEGSGAEKKLTPITFKIGYNPSNYDFITVNAIDVPTDVFVEIQKDATEAQSLAGSYVNSLVTISKNGKDFLYVGTANKGVFKSSDGGDSWTAINRDLTSSKINVLCTDGATLYIGTQDGGVFSSSNGGATWNSAGLSEKNITALVIEGSTLYAGTQDTGVFTSSDGGVTWSELNSGITDLHITALVFHGDSLYAGTTQGVFKKESTDDSWVDVSNGLTNLLVLYSDGENFYAGTNGGVYKYNGTTWGEALGTISGTVQTLYVQQGVLYAGTSSGVYSYNADENSWLLLLEGDIKSLYGDSTYLYAGTVFGMYRYNGTSWSWVNNGVIRPINVLYAVGNTLYAGTVTDGGVVESNDGGANWKPNKLIGNVQALSYYDNKLFAGTGSGLYYRKEDTTWEKIDALDNYIVESLYIYNNMLYVGMNKSVVGGLFKGQSVDDVIQWNSSGMESYSVKALCLYDNHIYAGAVDDGVFSSEDGTTWTLVESLQGLDVLSLHVYKDTLYIGTKGNGLYSKNGDTVNNMLVGMIYALSSGGGYLYAGGLGVTENNGIHRSNDGANWESCGNLPTNLQVSAMYSDDQFLYVGTTTIGDVIYKMKIEPYIE